MRVLVKNEANAAHNGIYVVTSDKVLTRAADFDTPAEIDGGDFTFVTGGQYNSTGWVQIDPVPVIGTDPIVFTQFSGAGTYTASNGLTLVGNDFQIASSAAGAGLAFAAGAFSVNATGGIEVAGDNVQLAGTVAGNGLSLTTGVLAVGGTADRITVSSDAVDIASTYVGQSSITTLGTITTGTWNGTTIAVANGGTGATTFTAGRVLLGNGTSPISEDADLAFNVSTNTLTVGSATIQGIADGAVVISSSGSSATNADISLDPKGTGSVNVNSAKIVNLADPVDPQDAATKKYVADAILDGGSF
jgi:hypothetical protein